MNANNISKEQWNAYKGVQTSGLYNMLDPRARHLANEMNECTLSREDWKTIISCYSELADKFDRLSEEELDNTHKGRLVEPIDGGKAMLTLDNTDNHDFEGEDVLVIDPCYFFKENGKNRIASDLWGQYCDAMFYRGNDKLLLDNPELHKELCEKLQEKQGLDTCPNKLEYYNLPSEYRFDSEGVCELRYGKNLTKSITFLYSGTADGDGSFVVEETGETFGVDAGMFCVVALNDLKDFLNASEYKDAISSGVRLGRSIYGVEMDGQGNCSGDITVYTDGSNCKSCQNCGEEYKDGEGSWDDDDYCSDSCYTDFNSTECENCGCNFVNGEGYDDEYCDSECHFEANKIECEECSEEFLEDDGYDDSFCCEDCYDEYHKEEDEDE